MLRALRRSAIAPVIALLVGVGSIPLSIEALAHNAADDTLCAPAFLLHDESAHRIDSGATGASEPEHCAICHWVRSLQTVETVARVVAPSSPSHQFTATTALAAGLIALGHLPARAPPVS